MYTRNLCNIVLYCIPIIFQFPASQVALVVKNLSANAGNIRDLALIPGSGRSPGEGNGNPLQCSGLENPMDRGAWRATVHGVTESQTRLSDLARRTHVSVNNFLNKLSWITHTKKDLYFCEMHDRVTGPNKQALDGRSPR